MFCIYCGTQTNNDNKICDACAAQRANSELSAGSPFQPEAPLLTNIPETATIVEQPPFQPEMLTSPEPVVTQPTFTYQWQGFAEEQPPVPAPPKKVVQDNSKYILALKEGMSSSSAMMTAILLSAGAVLTIANYLVGTNGTGILFSLVFMIGLPQIMAAIAAWISYTSAKSSREIPNTAGLVMANVVGILSIVVVACGIVLFLIMMCLVAAAGSLLKLSGIDWKALLGTDLTAYASISMGVIIGICLICIVAMALCIVFFALCNKNLGVMRSVLANRITNVKMSFFPIVWLYVITVFNVLGIVNYVDILISGDAFAKLTGIPNTTTPLMAIIGIAMNLVTGAGAIFASRAMSRCRKNLLEVQ